MKNSRIGFALLVVALAWSPLLADEEVEKTERDIVALPTLTTEVQQYCLLTFGPAAKTAVWIVHDGATLFVDRNGNGDLTEDGEKVAAEEYSKPDEGVFRFDVGEIADGNRLHKELTVRVFRLDHLARHDDEIQAALKQNPSARFYMVSADVEIPGRTGVGIGQRVQHIAGPRDSRGILRFSTQPETAPVVHFGGPWQVTLFSRQRLARGRQTDLVLGVGTAGTSPGTTAFVGYGDLIPRDVYPTVEISFPPKEGQRPVKQLYELKQRC